MDYSAFYSHPLSVSEGAVVPSLMASARPTLFFEDPPTPHKSHWQSVVLRVSETLNADAVAHPELAPVLIEALNRCLEQLLLFGRVEDLNRLEEWLNEEGGPRPNHSYK